MYKYIIVTLFVLCNISVAQSLNQYMEFIERWEGREHTAYIDSLGHRTIGVGHRLFDKKVTHLSDPEITRILAKDTLIAISDAKSLICDFNNKPSHVKLICVDLCFNLGKTKFSKFKKTINACNDGDYLLMSRELIDSKWYKQVGRRSKHHVKSLKETP